MFAVDADGLANLDGGEPAQSFAAQDLDQIDAYSSRARCASLCQRQLFFRVRTACDLVGTEGTAVTLPFAGLTCADRDMVIACLREHVPPDLVEDILVGGASWDDVN